MPRRRAKIIAWTLSLGIHAAVATLLIRDDAGQIRTLPQSESFTRDDAASDESSFTMSVEHTSDSVQTKSIAVTPPTGQRPVEPLRPTAISPELKKLVRELGNRPPARAVVQDVTAIDFREPVEVSKPMGGTSEPMPMVAKPGFGKGHALHGALPAGKSVVYILDRSTSMGLTRETFDAARATLVASVQALPAESRYQVIAYNGQATQLLPGRALLKKSAEQDELLLAALTELKPEGGSHHDVALRAALALGADYCIFITDAGEDELAKLRPILKGYAKPISVSVVRVEAGKVGEAMTFR